MTEVRRWDMEDVDRFNDWLQLKQDYSSAHSQFLHKQEDARNGKG